MAKPIDHTKPLQGRRIAITRERGQATRLDAQLRALGAEPVACPTIAIVPPLDWTPLDAAIRRLASYDWLIVTSANAVRSLLDRMAVLGRPTAALLSLKLGAVGPATAAALAGYGLQATFMPSSSLAESIVAEIGLVNRQRILLPCADIARDTLRHGLIKRGALVNSVVAYRTIPAPDIAELVPRLRTVDAITFTSSSTVRYLFDGLNSAGYDLHAARELLRHSAVACIGPVTAATAAEYGLPVALIASAYSSAGLVAALVDYFKGTL